MGNRSTRRLLLIRCGLVGSAMALDSTVEAGGLFASLRRRCRTRSKRDASAPCPSESTACDGDASRVAFWPKIAEGVVSALGSKLATKAFENTVFGGQDQQLRLMEHCRAVMHGQAFHRMGTAISKHRVAADLVASYRIAKPGSEQALRFLTLAQSNSEFAMLELKALGEMAREPWFIAACLRIAIAQEWYDRIYCTEETGRAVLRKFDEAKSYFDEIVAVELNSPIPHLGCEGRTRIYRQGNGFNYDTCGVYAVIPESGLRKLRFLNTASKSLRGLEGKLV